MLVDAGMGPGTILGIECGAMLENLGALGLTPSDITDVVFTHLHIDHVGWAVHEEQPVFTNATLRCSQADWDHFMVEHPDEVTAHLEPVRDRFETWAGSVPILPGLDVMAAPGHTPGSTVVVASLWPGAGDDAGRRRPLPRAARRRRVGRTVRLRPGTREAHPQRTGA